ncbi:TPA: acyltransferase, partial [Escherichia coli]
MEWSTALGSLRSTIISPLLLTACICLTFSRRLYVTKFLESKIMLFFGTISYTLYLLHPYVYKIIQIITIKIIYYDINIYALFWSFMVACTLVTIAISKVI